jgi:hypothetical protein
MNKTLSEKITKVSLDVIDKWIKDNPEEQTLSVVQQINYASLQLKSLGSEMESDYKKGLRGKITNDLH